MKRYTNRRASFARSRRTYVLVALARRYAPELAGASLAVLKSRSMTFILKGVYSEALATIADMHTPLLDVFAPPATPMARRAGGVYFDVPMR